MKLTIAEVAAIVQGTVNFNSNLIVTGANGLDEAGPEDISFLGNPKYAELLNTTKAGVVLVPQNIPEIQKPVIKVKNPQLAFAKILSIIESEKSPKIFNQIHSSCVIESSAKIGKDVSIGAFSVIEEGAVIGNNTIIKAHVYVGNNTVIGDNCIIYPNVTIRENILIGSRVIIHSGSVIGSDGFGFVPAETGIFKIPQIGKVEIDDDVEIGANVTIDRATTGFTKIGSGTKIDNLVQIAHNVKIGKNCMIVSQVGIAGSTKIGNNVVIGGQAGTVGHINIGDGVIVAARGAVTNNVSDKQVVSGYPARPHREALKIEALIHRLPELYEQIKKIKNEIGNKKS